MAAGSPPLAPSPARAECVLRGACAAMAAAGALLLGLSAQTKTVLFVQRRAVPKDVQALWVLIVSASAAAGYHVVQLARCLYMARLAVATGGGGCRRLSRGVACASFLLDKGCAYMVFATTVAALQACFVGLIGVEALQWSKLCNIYTRFCEQIAGSLVLGILAAAGTAVLSAVSARNVVRLYPAPPPPYAAH